MAMVTGSPFDRSIQEHLVASVVVLTVASYSAAGQGTGTRNRALAQVLTFPSPSPDHATIDSEEPCETADLDAVWGGSNAATGGQLLATVLVGNRGDRSCTITGMPALYLIG